MEKTVRAPAIEMPREVYEGMMALATARGLTFSAYTRSVLFDHVNSQESKKESTDA